MFPFCLFSSVPQLNLIFVFDETTQTSQMNMVPYEHVVNHARSLDPAFMPEVILNPNPSLNPKLHHWSPYFSSFLDCTPSMCIDTQDSVDMRSFTLTFQIPANSTPAEKSAFKRRVSIYGHCIWLWWLGFNDLCLVFRYYFLPPLLSRTLSW